MTADSDGSLAVMGPKYNVAGVGYPTKEAIRKRASALLRKKPLEEDDVAFLKGLLEWHPESDIKIGCGVERFYVKRTEYGTDGFVLVRTDATETDFSFMKCVTPPTHRSDVRAAMRNHIQEFSIRFRDAAFRGRDRVTCAITGELVSNEDSVVAYLAPKTFIELADEFIAAEGLTYDNVKVEPTKDGVTFWGLDDKALAGRWVTFFERASAPAMASEQASRTRGRK